MERLTALDDAENLGRVIDPMAITRIMHCPPLHLISIRNGHKPFIANMLCPLSFVSNGTIHWTNEPQLPQVSSRLQPEMPTPGLFDQYSKENSYGNANPVVPVTGNLGNHHGTGEFCTLCELYF